MKKDLIPKSLRQMQESAMEEKRGNIKNFGDKKADNFDKADAAKVNPAVKKKMKKKGKDESLMSQIVDFIGEKKGNIKNFGDKKAPNFDKEDAERRNKKKKKKDESLAKAISEGSVKLQPIGPNMTLLTTKKGASVMFSYETPVAGITPRGKIVRTKEKYSTTTTRHINKWLDGRDAEMVSQEYIDKLVQESFITESRNSNELSLWVDNDETLYNMKMDLFKQWSRRSADPEFSVDRKRMVSSLDGLIDAAAEMANISRLSRSDRIEFVDDIFDEYKSEYMDESLSEKDTWPDDKQMDKGRFTEYCKREGFEGPCIACAKKAMKSDDASVRGMASFYMNTVKPNGKDASHVAKGESVVNEGVERDLRKALSSAGYTLDREDNVFNAAYYTGGDARKLKKLLTRIGFGPSPKKMGYGGTAWVSSATLDAIAATDSRSEIEKLQSGGLDGNIIQFMSDRPDSNLMVGFSDYYYPSLGYGESITSVDEALNEITRGTPIDRVADKLVGYMKSEVIPRHTSESVAKVLDEAGFQLIDTRGGCDKWSKGEYTRLASAMMQHKYRKMYSETNKEVWVGPAGDHIVYDIIKIEAEVYNPDLNK